MASGTRIRIKSTIDMSAFKSKSEKTIQGALDRAALAMLEWTEMGAPWNPKQAPIRWGILSGSGSVFVGSRLINTSAKSPRKGSATPNRSYSGNKHTITVGFNTAYAARMHETKLNPGPFSRQAGPERYPGNQWVTSHLQTDGPQLMKVIAGYMKDKL